MCPPPPSNPAVRDYACKHEFLEHACTANTFVWIYLYIGKGGSILPGWILRYLQDRSPPVPPPREMRSIGAPPPHRRDRWPHDLIIWISFEAYKYILLIKNSRDEKSHDTVPFKISIIQIDWYLWNILHFRKHNHCIDYFDVLALDKIWYYINIFRMFFILQHEKPWIIFLCQNEIQTLTNRHILRRSTG